MLSAGSRLTRAEDFRVVVRRGRRSARRLLVVHQLLAAGDDPAADPGGEGPSPRVGFVVSRAVGGSVVRHRVQRRLRHLMRSRLGALPPGARLVVRALPAAAAADSAALGDDLDRALRRIAPAAP